MFFQKAYEGRNRWWRWLVTISGTLVIIMLAQVLIIAFVKLEAERLGVSKEIFNAQPQTGADRNLFLVLLLFPFLMGLLALWFFLRRLHKKSLRSVMTGRVRFDWRRVLAGFAIWFIVLAIVIFAALPADSYVYRFDPATFWPLLLVALLLFPAQTSLEEILFRGYLMQGFFLLAKNKLVPLIFVSVLFVLMHYWNPEFSVETGAAILEYSLMSLFLGLVAVLDDGLELPIGIHAANNIFLAVMMSTSDGSIQTNALFESDLKAFHDNFLALSVAPYAVSFVILFVLSRWRFSTLVESVALRPTA